MRDDACVVCQLQRELSVKIRELRRTGHLVDDPAAAVAALARWNRLRDEAGKHEPTSTRSTT